MHKCYSANVLAKFLMEHNQYCDTTIHKESRINLCRDECFHTRMAIVLQLTENILIALEGNSLVKGNFYVTEYGAHLEKLKIDARYCGTENKVRYDIFLSAQEQNEYACISEEHKRLLLGVYEMLIDAPIGELIEISKEDPAYIAKRNGYYKEERRMENILFRDQYKEQYDGAIMWLEANKYVKR